MGIEYNTGVLFGYAISFKKLLEPFIKTVEEEFHYETRFDQKTGVRLKPQKVIDRHGENAIFFKGEELVGPQELLERICSEVGCFYAGFDHMGVEDDLYLVFLGLTPDKSLINGRDYGNVSAGPSYDWKDVVKLEKELEELSHRLRELGIDPGPLGVWTTTDIY